jgi:hypothetical protein
MALQGEGSMIKLELNRDQAWVVLALCKQAIAANPKLAEILTFVRKLEGDLDWHESDG